MRRIMVLASMDAVAGRLAAIGTVRRITFSTPYQRPALLRFR